MKVLFLKGIPASGKSTFAQSLRPADLFASLVHISNKDEIRARYPSLKEKQVLQAERADVESAMQRRSDLIVIDNTHLNPDHEIFYRDLATQYGYEFEVKWFDDSLNPELCHKRNAARERSVPYEVIEKMHVEYFKQWMVREGHQISVGDDDGRMVAIVDIDGTVAEMGDRGPFEWHKVDRDSPIRDIVHLVHTMNSSMGLDIIFMSGRDESCRAMTEDWINQHLFLENGYQLFMRPEGDMRADRFVKFELFMQHINGKYDVRYVLDDRRQVVRMWRALGLRCLSVAEGFF